MVRVDNDPVALAATVTEAGPSPEVVIEATYGWYWVVDLLQELCARVHLANPTALNSGDRRVKDDVVDATDLADHGAVPGRAAEWRQVAVCSASRGWTLPEKEDTMSTPTVPDRPPASASAPL